ncbi:NAD(P)-binding domain-containing protein [Streptomyces sp. NPDC004667]|uniref:NAD(P)-binding domain-containing protein n=1 Tax=Streptomyces sp. NPDC004667 TaxID=3154285 RepID=UPI0033BD3A10
MEDRLDLVVVGAGPFGLSTAAAAQEKGLRTLVLGRPMGFWTDHMPARMLLRSGTDWHLDAAGTHTMEAYLAARGTPADLPLPLASFLDYARWFRERKQLDVVEEYAASVVPEAGAFSVRLAGGDSVRAAAVVAAPGVQHFAHRPAWAETLPREVALHSSDAVDFDGVAGRHVVIVGGRQSAYECAALAAGHGAARVDLVHRHPVPRFEHVSWSFFDDYLDKSLKEPGWWRHLPEEERQEIVTRCWTAGRATLEPWLPPLLDPEVVHVHAERDVRRVERAGTGSGLRFTLTDGQVLSAHQVILATGYRADVGRIPYLRPVTDLIATRDGFPVLDERQRTTVPGFHMTGFVATQDFGPFFGFVRAAPVAASLISDALTR